MKRTIQAKIDKVVALSKKSGSAPLIREKSRSGDSLSSSIRTRRDAEIFIQELNAAFKSGKK